jgi:hypothetical protein
MQVSDEVIPFQTWGNWQVLTEKQIKEMPWLLEFIKAFPNCFEYDFMNSIWVFNATL